MHLLPLHARPVSDVAEGGDTQYTISQVNGGFPLVIGPWTKCRLTRVSSGPLSVCKPAHDGRRKSGQLSSRPNDIINFKPIMLFKYLKCKLYFYGPRVG